MCLHMPQLFDKLSPMVHPDIARLIRPDAPLYIPDPDAARDIANKYQTNYAEFFAEGLAEFGFPGGPWLHRLLINVQEAHPRLRDSHGIVVGAHMALSLAQSTLKTGESLPQLGGNGYDMLVIPITASIVGAGERIADAAEQGTSTESAARLAGEARVALGLQELIEPFLLAESGIRERVVSVTSEGLSPVSIQNGAALVVAGLHVALGPGNELLRN
jgi:hypothetical protein